MVDSPLVDAMKMTAVEFTAAVERLRRDEWRESLKTRDQRDLAALGAKFQAAKAAPEKETRLGTASGTTTSKARAPSPSFRKFDAMELSDAEFMAYVRGFT